MAPRPVFIGIEAEFLLDRLDQFRASQDASSVSNFMTRICAEYLATWPVDNQDEEKRLRKVKFLFVTVDHVLTLCFFSKYTVGTTTKSARK